MTKFFSFLIISAFLAIPALAAEAPAKTEKAVSAKEKKEAPKKEEATPITKWRDAENKMIDPLNDLDMESIFIMRQKYGIIKTVGVVEKDVTNGVASCGKANPDMKAAMESRLAQWKKAVNPVVELANKNLMAEVDKQTIVDPAEFKKVLKLQDAAYVYGEKKTTKNYATGKDVCEALLESMNDSEDTLVGLLQDTLLPPSVIQSRVRKTRAEVEGRKSFSKEKTAQ